MTLAIETVNYVLVRVIETLHWEIPGVTSHNVAYEIPYHLMLFKIPNEMIVSLVVIVKEGYENARVADETTRDERVLEIRDRYRIVVDPKELIDLQLIILDLPWGPEFEAERPNPEKPIVHVGGSEVLSGKVLLNLQHLNTGS